MRRLLARIFGIGTLLIIAGLCMAPQAFASTYGQSQYGVCKFAVGCPPQHSVVETRSGLQVAINLTDGQVIPKGTYQVKVTPLNGEGRSFERVEFYLDGVLIDTFYPDTSGTATWDWDSNRHQGNTIKIIVYDTDGTSIAQEYKISIVEAGQQGGVGNNLGALPGTSSGQAEGPVAQMLAFLEASIRAVPRPIALSIPFLLLLTLVTIILMLLAQSRREADEMKRRMLALDRARQLAEEKDGFIELTSHYLRTPLTLIRGGVDYMNSAPALIHPAVLTSLTNAVNEFGDSIERLLARVSSDPRLQAIPDTPDLGARMHIWTVPQFWVPVAGTGIALALMNFLLVRAGTLDISFVYIATQVAVYVALVIVMYALLRSRELHARDRRRADEQGQQQAAIDEARNELIHDAAASLAQKLGAIYTFMHQVPEGQGLKFMNEGYERIAEVLRRFRATAMVVPPVTTMPFVSFSLSALVSRAEKPIAEAAAAKRVTITGGTVDVQLASPQPAWLVQILSSVLDNAIAYSQPGSSIEIGGMVQQGKAVLYVRDHGEGIPPEKLAELFQPFSKAEGPLAFDHPGIGLSLYLDRLLITNLGGEMRIESTPGNGTTVTIAFPIR